MTLWRIALHAGYLRVHTHTHTHTEYVIRALMVRYTYFSSLVLFCVLLKLTKEYDD
jgi:hypothetical protein